MAHSHSTHSLSSKDPWSRFKGGSDFALSIERGREQDALWLLQDGIDLPAHLLAEALCCASAQGLAELGKALMCKGASPSSSAAARAPLTRDSSVASGFKGCEPTYRCGILALFGGHLQWARHLSASAGPEAFGGTGGMAILYAKVAMKSKLSGERKKEALKILRPCMDLPELASAASFLCLAGGFDSALETLVCSDPFDAPKIAKAMLAPLCAYPQNDPGKELALIVLEQAVELSEGRQEKGFAPWTPSDLAALGCQRYGEKVSAREDHLFRLAESMGSWSSSKRVKKGALPPRVAASMSGNYQALEMIKGLSPISGEFESLKACAQSSISFFEGKIASGKMPSSFEQRLPMRLEKGFDALGWARSANALCESTEITQVVKQSEQAKKKTAKRECKIAWQQGADVLPVAEPVKRAGRARL